MVSMETLTFSMKLETWKWVGACFIYVNNDRRMNYSIGGKIQTLVHLETASGGTTKHSIIGYLAKDDRIFAVDKSLNISSHSIILTVLQYQTDVMSGDFISVNELLTYIPQPEYTTLLRFFILSGLQGRGYGCNTKS